MTGSLCPHSRLAGTGWQAPLCLCPWLALPAQSFISWPVLLTTVSGCLRVCQAGVLRTGQGEGHEKQRLGREVNRAQMHQGLHVWNPWVSWATLLVPGISVLQASRQPCIDRPYSSCPVGSRKDRAPQPPSSWVTGAMHPGEACITCPLPALIIPAPLLLKDGLDPAILQGKIPRGPPTLARPEGCVVGELGFSSLICCRMLGYLHTVV